MILGVSPVLLSNRYAQNNKPIKRTQDVSFHGLKSNVHKYAGLSLVALTLFTLAACNRGKSDIKEVAEEITIEGSTDVTINNGSEPVQETTGRKSKKIYHYYPSENELKAEDYSWSETIFPNGTVKRDSCGYDITIEPKVGRTVEYKTTDEQGNTTTIKEFPDGTKVEITDYSVPNETLSVKTTYWTNGQPRFREYFNKYQKDSLTQAVDSAKYEYNENGMLIRWIDAIKDPERTDSNNVYDRYGRLTYDDVANEKYFYKGKSKIPYQATSQYDKCTRYRIFNPDGTVQKIYFKAEDGTITDVDN